MENSKILNIRKKITAKLCSIRLKIHMELVLKMNDIMEIEHFEVQGKRKWYQ